jgi:urease accessory protein
MHERAHPEPACGWTDTEVSVSLRRGAGGAVRVHGVLCQAPVWFRWDGATLWLVGSGAAPVGDDRVRVRIEVGPGVAVAVRSVAATVIYAARGPGTTWDTEIHVADGASLDWRPEPVILTERARHAATTSIHASAGAEVTVDEVLVLGRAAEATGSLRSTLSVRTDGTHALETSIDTSVPGWAGPAGVAGATVVGHRLRLGAEPSDGGTDADAPPGAVLLRPAPGCRLAVATAAQVADARRTLDALLS